MGKFIHIALAVSIIFTACENNDNNNDDTFKSETINMGANSTRDVYYSLSNSDVNSIERSDWDVGFSVPLQTATILINEGAGVELYAVGDTSEWELVDETSYLNIDQRLNNKTNWSEGAFNINASGFPNYGWGTYHASGDHNVVGDSIYVLKLSNGSFKKFMVKAKLGANSANILHWADLDGNNEVTDTFSTTPYFDKKHFIHYSLVNKKVVEAEPDMSEWDLLFTYYMDIIPTGPSSFMYYPFMGVLTKPDVKAVKLTGIDPEKLTLSDIPEAFSTSANIIGHDWKISDPVTHEISLADSTGYLIQTIEGKTYAMYFTEYAGKTTGTTSFKVKVIEQ
jgi:hypothetical protein